MSTILSNSNTTSKLMQTSEEVELFMHESSRSYRTCRAKNLIECMSLDRLTKDFQQEAKWATKQIDKEAKQLACQLKKLEQQRAIQNTTEGKGNVLEYSLVEHF